MYLCMGFADMEYSITRLIGVAYSWATNTNQRSSSRTIRKTLSNRIIATTSFASIGMLHSISMMVFASSEPNTQNHLGRRG